MGAAGIMLQRGDSGRGRSGSILRTADIEPRGINGSHGSKPVIANSSYSCFLPRKRSLRAAAGITSNRTVQAHAPRTGYRQALS